MADEIAGSAGPDKPVESDNLTEDDFISSLLTQAAEEPEEDEAEEPEEEPEPEEGEEPAEEEEETEEPEAESGIDFENLTPEQWDEIAEKLKSDAAKRIGKLTRRAKTAEEQLVTKAKEVQANPLEQSRKVENPRIAAISTIEELKSEMAQAESLEEWAQAILDENGSADAGDIISSHQGRELTKKDILTVRNNARSALKKDIPARLAEIQTASELEIRRTEFDAKAEVLFPEIAKDESPVKATFEMLMADPAMKEAFEKVPAFRAYGKLMLAHAAQSIHQLNSQQAKVKPKAATAPGDLPRPKAPASPASAGAASSKPIGKQKEVESRKRQFEQSGSSDDFAALLASRIK